MNAKKGTFRMIYEDALTFAGKILLLWITLPLLAAWLILGYYVDLAASDVVSAISGPVYFMIPFLAIAGHRTLFPVAMGMGSTRDQFLKCYYGVSIAALLFLLVLLNAGQYLLVKMSHIILHPGPFLIAEYHFFSYLWLDVIFGLLLFGIAFFLYAVWYRMGLVRSLTLFMGITIAVIFLYHSEFPGRLAERVGITAPEGTALAVILTLTGLGLIFATYPVLRKASIYPAGR
jgi:hypothetical protein